MNDMSSTPAALEATMMQLGASAREALGALSIAPREAKDEALRAAAARLREDTDGIITANAKDMAAAQSAGRADAYLDRLKLDVARIDAMAAGLEAIADLADPVGETIAEWRRPNGLLIERRRTPLGVIGVIYESRPNVTADAGGLCLKA
ncbi:MAG: gamma-glutamyl-phosphate reductase, partial [Pseudomonadota bacterium]